jgi:site-specific recombinase XerD
MTPREFDSAVARFLIQLDADGRSEHTILQYRRHLFAFRRWLEERDGDGREGTTHSEAARLNVVHEEAAITPEVIAAFFVSTAARESARGGAKKPTSLNSMRSSMRAFFGYCRDAGLVAENPARLLRRAMCGAHPPRFLAPADEAKLLATIDAAAASGDRGAQRDAALVRLLTRTGIRISSALGLDIDHIDSAAGEIEIRVAKRQQVVRVPVSGATITMLIELAGCRTIGPLFVTKDGKRIGRRHAARRIADWARRADIAGRVHPHLFRHGLAVRLLESTSDLRLVQTALGHRSIASTVVYTRVAGARVRAAMLAVEGVS